jgi:Flp pilus assembly protein TadD
MDILKQQLSLEPANSPAVAALASCIKDFGAIDEATQLYELALSLTPCKPSYILNLIHLLEVSNKYLSALDKATAFCHNLPDFHVGGLQLRYIA